ncbi:MAG: histidinol-phosphate transaminase [Gammaproteobacteria bacterium]|nr:histidinol-phosphate transaminase [Gammaproteobacteria bacterium]
MNDITFDPLDYCRPGLAGLAPYEPGKPPGALERELGVRDAVKLASNENLRGPSPQALAALRRALTDVHFYPDGGGHQLKELLAARHGVAPGQITLGNGSNELLELTARCFLGPAAAAVYSRHAFAVYALVTQASGADARVAAPLPAADAMPCGNDLEAMLEQVNDATAVVFIANPNNPTGTWAGEAALRGFLRRLPRRVVAVVDQAYAEYAAGADCPDAAAWLGEFPNLIVTRTFSKVFALAGLRIGYALSSPAMAELLNRLRQPFNVNGPAQCAAAAALGDRRHLDDSVRANAAGLARLRDGLSRLGVACLPSAANFLCFEVGDDARRVYDELLVRGVIVRPLANYKLPRHLRVTVGLPEHNERFLDAFTAVAGAGG